MISNQLDLHWNREVMYKYYLFYILVLIIIISNENMHWNKNTSVFLNAFNIRLNQRLPKHGKMCMCSDTRIKHMV